MNYLNCYYLGGGHKIPLKFALFNTIDMILLITLAHFINNICFVGRPFTDSKIKMMYFLADGQTPSGAYPGEDAISFDPNRVRAAEIDGRWKLVQDDMWMLDFGSNKEQAVNAEQIVKYYGFTKQCFVGRPGPPMMYWRK